MSQTTSGDYRIPTPLRRWAGNHALSVARFVPKPLANWYTGHHGYYQSFNGSPETSGGFSEEKWKSLPLPESLAGRTLLDIGCAEGFFCIQAAKRGAREAVGMDCRFTTLLCAAFLARRSGAAIAYKIGVFPAHLPRTTFDVVLCLSVIHHLLSTKNVMEIFGRDDRKHDVELMQDALSALSNVTATGGTCVVELPSERPNDQEDRDHESNSLCELFVRAGFGSATCHGSWITQETESITKRRWIYVATK